MNLEDWTTKQIDKYVLVNKKLGNGAFGTVYRGFLKNDESKQVAVKTIPIKSIKDSAKMIELIKREINILQQAQHPNIVRLYDVARTPHYLYLFLEYCNDGDLKQYLIKKQFKRMSEVEAVTFLKHIVEGFRQLYALKIIHRDIKPANILLHNGVAKITDFGFARVIETEMNDPSFFSRVGSPLYMAPQILEGLPFSSKCDVWSLGIMLYEFLYGKTPWEGDSQYSLLQNIKKIPLKFPGVPVRSEKIKEFLVNSLKVSEKERYSWEQIFTCEIILIDESKLKQNMELLIQIKEDAIQPSTLNNLYLEQNLVVGYLRNPSEIKESDSPLQNAPQDKIDQESFNEDKEKGQQIIQGYEVEASKRKQMQRYHNYFLFERNIAFFFNYVIQKLISLTHKGQLKFSKEQYYLLMFVISKNQNSHLYRIKEQMNSKKPETFDLEIWGKFLLSPEYKKVQALTMNDMKHTVEFFTQVSKKIKDGILPQMIDIKKASKINEVLDINFGLSSTFQQFYIETLQESINHMKHQINELKEQKLISKDENKEILQFSWFLIISLNPYQDFKDINMDFNYFYEEIQNFSVNELLEKIIKK